MPGSNQNGGGPWGGGGGGGGGKGPWGGGGGGRQPPDIEELLRRSQDRMKKLVPGGASGKLIAAVVAVAALAWIAFGGIYLVQEGEQGVELTFGKWDETTEAGLRINWPAPVGETIVVNVQVSNRLDIGFRSADEDGRGTTRRVPEESLMLTGDQNIADIEVRIAWRIGDVKKYLFSIRYPEGTVKVAAESAMREVVGQTVFIEAVGEGRGIVQEKTLVLLQDILDSYDSGIIIEDVQIQKSRPPAQVVDAFDDLQRAEQDKERIENEADAYANSIVPVARGDAARLVQEAEAYKERLIQEADGEAQRFLSVYEAYRLAPEVTRRRMYLESIGEVMASANKVIIDSEGGGTGVVPYLPLPELQSRRKAPASQ